MKLPNESTIIIAGTIGALFIAASFNGVRLGKANARIKVLEQREPTVIEHITNPVIERHTTTLTNCNELHYWPVDAVLERIDERIEQAVKSGAAETGSSYYGITVY